VIMSPCPCTSSGVTTIGGSFFSFSGAVGWVETWKLPRWGDSTAAATKSPIRLHMIVFMFCSQRPNRYLDPARSRSISLLIASFCTSAGLRRIERTSQIDRGPTQHSFQDFKLVLFLTPLRFKKNYFYS
jgi:hypothetical protein